MSQRQLHVIHTDAHHGRLAQHQQAQWRSGQTFTCHTAQQPSSGR